MLLNKLGLGERGEAILRRVRIRARVRIIPYYPASAGINAPHSRYL
jgi:hypothetical protein